MRAKLFIVYGSHPCATVEKALALKGIKYKTVELIPPSHAPLMKLRFGQRTVPALKINGEKLVGSRTILRRLDELVPESPLLPSDQTQAAKVLEAEEWGDSVLQAQARRLLWAALSGSHESVASYNDGAKVQLPAAVVKRLANGIIPIEKAMNGVSKKQTEKDLKSLMDHFDHVDHLIAEGVIGGIQPNAADLQIASSIRLLLTLDDVSERILSRPCAQLALRYFPDAAGRVPSGKLKIPA